MFDDLVLRFREENRRREAEGLSALLCPGRKALEMEIDRLDPYHAYSAREGEEKARKKFFIVNAGLDITFPLERVELDESLVPLQTFMEKAEIWERLTEKQKKTVQRSRLWVGTAIDARTRCYLALRLIRKPTSAEAVATLEMAVHDKAEFAEAAGCVTPWDMAGRGVAYSSDNGASYVGHEYRSAVIDLRASYVFGPARLPQMRGRKERSYRTINDQLIAYFDGRTFENVVAKGDYDAEALATINDEELGRVLVRFIVDVYHNKPHAGLGGESPRNCWLRLTRRYGIRQAPGRDERRHIFGTTLELNLGTDGVRVLGNLYQSLELQRYRPRTRGKRVLVRVGKSDLGHVSVRTDDGGSPSPACARAWTAYRPPTGFRRWQTCVAVLRTRRP